jgi:dihydrodipicolinate synthase/N-acetylneuraminate lyase
MNDVSLDPIQMLRPRRRIEGNSAILLPFHENGDVDWNGFTSHVERTAHAGLIPAVNMDTGYGNLIDDATRKEALRLTHSVLSGGRYLAGAFVRDEPGARFNFDAYAARMHEIQNAGGTPVIFQSHGLTGQPDEAIIAAYQRLGSAASEFIGFELGTMFAPFGRIYSMDVFRGLLEVKNCTGAKHSSLRRDLEWARLLVRDSVRPDFRVYTGNDLAIDMVMYGSDYLLGLSTFAPDLFAQRDRAWLAGDPAFYTLNDILQYLGFLAFRAPVPAYKHSAAMFLKLRGWIGCDHTHPQSPSRPDADREILSAILQQIDDVVPKAP